MARRGFVGLVAAVSLVSLLVSGCGELAATPDPVTITFAHPQDPTGVYAEWAQQFQDLHPHITVELTTDRRAAGADAFLASQFDLPQDGQADAFIDLTSFIEQSEDLDIGDFYPSALSVFRSQGRQWALPFGLDLMVMFYNQDLFDSYGIPYPQIGWTWSDFLDRALDLTDPGAGVYGYALQYSDDFGIYEPVMMIYQHGGRIFDSLDAPTRATLDDPSNIEAMDFYASLIHVHRIAPTYEEVQRFGRAYPWGGIFDGRFAMWSMMVSQRGGTQWSTPWRMNWGMVPMPADVTAGTLAVADGLFIASGTEHPEEAWLWIKFLSGQQPPFTVPTRISLAQSQQYEQSVGIAIAEASRAAVADAILVNPGLLGFDAALGALAEALTLIRSGEATPEMALTAAQTKSGY